MLLVTCKCVHISCSPSITLSTSEGMPPIPRTAPTLTRGATSCLSSRLLYIPWYYQVTPFLVTHLPPSSDFFRQKQQRQAVPMVSNDVSQISSLSVFGVNKIPQFFLKFIPSFVTLSTQLTYVCKLTLSKTLRACKGHR